MFRDDDSVQSANLPVKDEMAVNRLKLDGMYRGMVLKVYYSDDVGNVTKGSQTPQVTYDVILKSGPLEGQIVQNVRNASALGGKFNYSEIVLKKASKPFSGAGFKPFNQQDGDIVYVEFTNGNLSSPVITNCGTSPLDMTGAKRSDGPRWTWQYNGINWLINKNGEFILTRKGGNYDAVEDLFTPKDNNEAQIKFMENTLTQSAGPDAKKVTQVLDGVNQKMTITMASGMVVTIDGENDFTKVQTKGGASLIVDGKNDVIKAQDKGTGTLKISNNKVGLGASSAELLDQLSKALQKHIDFLNNTDSQHTHIGNLGYETLVPSQAAQFVALATSLSAIKALIDGIKGGI